MRQEVIEQRKKAILDDLKSIGKAEELNAFLYTKKGKFSLASVINYFGSLQKACEEAKIPYGRKHVEQSREIQARNEDIKKRVLAGETYESIGRIYDLSRERVRQCANSLGVKSSKWENAKAHTRELTQIELDKLQNLYFNGKRKLEIAKEMNLLSTYVSKVIEDNQFVFGTFCSNCSKHITKKNRYFNTYTYCDDCGHEVFNKKHNDYIAARLRRDPKFRDKMYAKNRAWRKRKANHLSKH